MSGACQTDDSLSIGALGHLGIDVLIWILLLFMLGVLKKDMHCIEQQYISFFNNAWQRPILAGSDPPTTFGVLKLNFCVRHGNRCILQAIITTLFVLTDESLCSQN